MSELPRIPPASFCSPPSSWSSLDDLTPFGKLMVLWLPLPPTSRRHSNLSPAYICSLGVLLDTSTWISQRKPEFNQSKLNHQTQSSSNIFCFSEWNHRLLSLWSQKFGNSPVFLTALSCFSYLSFHAISYLNSSYTAVIDISVILKLNDMISLSEMLWLYATVRTKSTCPYKTYQTLHSWTAASCLVLVPWDLCAQRMLCPLPVNQVPWAQHFLSHLWAFPLHCSLCLKCFSRFYPRGKLLLVFKTHPKLSYFPDYLTGISLFWQHSWKTSFKALVPLSCRCWLIFLSLPRPFSVFLYSRDPSYIYSSLTPSILPGT